MSEPAAPVARLNHGLDAVMAELPPAGPGTPLVVHLQPGFACLNLRANLGDDRLAAALEAVLGQALPRVPNTVSGGAHRVFWLGPDEWLIVTPPPDFAGLLHSLQRAADGGHAAVTDLSGGYQRMTLAGPGATEVLSQGCTLDLLPSAFGAGRCAQTGLARAGVLLAPLPAAKSDAAGGEGYELYVRRSFAGYLLRWLAHAGAVRHIGFERAGGGEDI